MKKITSFLMVLFVALGAMAQDEATATLVHTASSYCGTDASKFTSTVDAEKEHINNAKFSNTWAGAAYAEFSIAVPGGHSITNASLAWSGVGSNKNRTTDVMYVNAGLTLDYETMKSTGTEKVDLGATKIATVTITADKTVDFVTDVTEAVTAIMNDGQTYIIFKFTNNAGGGDLVGKGAAEKFPVLTIETADASAMTTYTVKYVDESGNEIKAESVYDILAGETASIADENKVAIYTNDKKYIYKSCDKESITTVADGASNVITATFREAETWNYTVNAVDGDGNVLKVLATGSNFEGETITVPYNQYILKGGVLYEAGVTNKEYNMYIALSSDNMTSDVTYSVSSKTNVVYFSEAEEIEGMTGTTSGNANVRCSNSVGAYNASEAPVEVLTLTPGTYTITAQVWGNSGMNITITCGEQSLVVATKGYILSGNAEFTLTENSLVTIPQCGNTSKCLDWILIQSAEANSLLVAEEGKDLDVEGNYASATYTRTIAADTYGTICLPFAPDAASLENYTFFKMESAGADAINFVEETAPQANTPYIYCLKGENVAITGGATVVSADINSVEVGNWTMEGSFTKQTIATAGADTKFYGYVADQNKIVKANKTLTVLPYRAYFTAPVNAAAVALRITRGDETTEITAADLDVQPATVIYDLAGRRVEKMEKGIYIVNGKKVIR